VGLGLGLHKQTFINTQTLALKKEGDGKSPAGIFRLSSLFGYSKLNPNSKMPYIHLDSTMHCVDDSDSKYYNQIITQRSGYRSFEKMRREDNLYQFGIVVEHNRKGIKKRGSCIFIHIQNKKRGPTSGCTAMSKDDLLKIIHWLDQSKHPILLQNLSQEPAIMSKNI